MFKTILVPATGSDTADGIFAAALSIARTFSAHLIFLHVRTDRAGLEEAMAVAGPEALMVPGEFIERAEGEAREHERRTEEQVRDFCARQKLVIADAPHDPVGPSAEWRPEIGSEEAVLVGYGQASDLLVIGRPGEGVDLASGAVEAALFETGRPLFIPTPGAVPTEASGQMIAIAWKPTAQSARAVSAAMPLLSKAKRVAILTVGNDDAGEVKSSATLAAMLGWHGIEATTHHLPEDAGSAVDTLFAAARDLDARLVVMGGYGHSRAREFMFGGFTEQVLRGAPLPVLICH